MSAWFGLVVVVKWVALASRVARGGGSFWHFLVSSFFLVVSSGGGKRRGAVYRISGVYESLIHATCNEREIRARRT